MTRSLNNKSLKNEIWGANLCANKNRYRSTSMLELQMLDYFIFLPILFLFLLLFYLELGWSMTLHVT